MSEATVYSRAMVFPAITAGLHCGPRLGGYIDTFILVFPAITAGLHCGTLWNRVDTALKQVFPAITAGLHCGTKRIFWGVVLT